MKKVQKHLKLQEYVHFTHVCFQIRIFFYQKSGIVLKEYGIMIHLVKMITYLKCVCPSRKKRHSSIHVPVVSRIIRYPRAVKRRRKEQEFLHRIPFPYPKQKQPSRWADLLDDVIVWYVLHLKIHSWIQLIKTEWNTQLDQKINSILCLLVESHHIQERRRGIRKILPVQGVIGIWTTNYKRLGTTQHDGTRIVLRLRDISWILPR